jgi:hypothetical protein
MELSYLTLNAPAGDLDFDLALDVRGNPPSLTDVGSTTLSAALPADESGGASSWWIAALVAAALAIGAAVLRWRRIRAV